jgi:hypothetical protein
LRRQSSPVSCVHIFASVDPSLRVVTGIGACL